MTGFFSGFFFLLLLLFTLFCGVHLEDKFATFENTDNDTQENLPEEFNPSPIDILDSFLNPETLFLGIQINLENLLQIIRAFDPDSIMLEDLRLTLQNPTVWDLIIGDTTPVGIHDLQIAMDTTTNKSMLQDAVNGYEICARRKGRWFEPTTAQDIAWLEHNNITRLWVHIEKYKRFSSSMVFYGGPDHTIAPLKHAGSKPFTYTKDLEKCTYLDVKSRNVLPADCKITTHQVVCQWPAKSKDPNTINNERLNWYSDQLEHAYHDLKTEINLVTPKLIDLPTVDCSYSYEIFSHPYTIPAQQSPEVRFDFLARLLSKYDWIQKILRIINTGLNMKGVLDWYGIEIGITNQKDLCIQKNLSGAATPLPSNFPLPQWILTAVLLLLIIGLLCLFGSQLPLNEENKDKEKRNITTNHITMTESVRELHQPSTRLDLSRERKASCPQDPVRVHTQIQPSAPPLPKSVNYGHSTIVEYIPDPNNPGYFRPGNKMILPINYDDQDHISVASSEGPEKHYW